METTREAAIRYVGANYDKEQLDRLLNEEITPHPVHEQPLIQAFIAGAEWAYKHPISPWISVEQRLPPVKIRVLFLDKNGKVWLGRNTIAMQAELETDENNNLLPPPTVPPAKPVITHWMPIPKV